MKKLKLEMDELAVETFATAAEPAAGGTVHGQDLGRTLLNLCTQMTGLCPCTPRAEEI